jgi:hypothetical protein
MDKAWKVQNILIVITAIIIAIFIAQVAFNILDNKGASLMQIPYDRLKNNNNVNYHYPTTAAVQQQAEQSTAIKSSPTRNIALPAESSSSLTSIFKQDAVK